MKYKPAALQCKGTNKNRGFKYRHNAGRPIRGGPFPVGKEEKMWNEKFCPEWNCGSWLKTTISLSLSLSLSLSFQWKLAVLGNVPEISLSAFLIDKHPSNFVPCSSINAGKNAAFSWWIEKLRSSCLYHALLLLKYLPLPAGLVSLIFCAINCAGTWRFQKRLKREIFMGEKSSKHLTVFNLKVDFIYALTP